MIKMTKLNWRDAKQELPANTGLTYECLIVVQYIDNNKICHYITSSYFSFNSKNELRWDSVNSDEIVICWLAISEIPLPTYPLSEE